MTRPAWPPTPPSHRDELVVLSLIGAGMIITVILVICGIFGWFTTKTTLPLPNWAENVLVSIISIFAVKIGDVLAALVTLASGRQVESMTTRLADSTPPKKPTPADAGEAADQVADAAASEATDIKDAVDQSEGTTP